MRRQTERARPSKDSTLSEHTLNVLGSLKSAILEAFGADTPSKPDPPFCSRTSLIQLWYGVRVSLNPAVVGMAFGYTAVAVPMLQMDAKLKFTENQLSWFASILTLSAPIGCVIVGHMIDKLGRRTGLIISEVPMAIGWLYIALSTSPMHLIIGRAVTGLGVGMIMPPTRVYSSEISLPNMRGVLGTIPNLAIATGLTVQAVVGMFVQWRTLSYINFAISSSLILMNMSLPETPYFVLMSDTEENAGKTLKKFRSNKYDIDAELQKLKNFKQTNDIRKLTRAEKLKVLMTPASCKPFWIINTFNAITQLSGITVLAFWTIIILEKANSSVDPKLGNSLAACVRIFGSLLGAVLIYFWGRRTIAFVSGIGVSLAFFCLAVNCLVTDKPSMVPQICVMVCMCFACLGWHSLPMLMMSELYPLQVRGILGGLSVSWFNIIAFGANMISMPMMDHWGFEWTVMQYSIWALVGVIILYFILPETKGLTLQEIEEYYNKRRPSLMSQKQLESEMLARRSGLQLSGRRTRSERSKQSGLNIMPSTITMALTVQKNNLNKNECA